MEVDSSKAQNSEESLKLGLTQTGRLSPPPAAQGHARTEGQYRRSPDYYRSH